MPPKEKPVKLKGPPKPKRTPGKPYTKLTEYKPGYTTHGITINDIKPYPFPTYLEGRKDYDREIGTTLVREYVNQNMCLAEACRVTGVNYMAALRWRKTFIDFREMMETAESLVADLVHHEFMKQVFDPSQRNPAWKIFFMKNWDQRYSESKIQRKAIEINITDNTFGVPKLASKVVEGEVIEEAK